jgi:hypothetical protein
VQLFLMKTRLAAIFQPGDEVGGKWSECGTMMTVEFSGSAASPAKPDKGIDQRYGTLTADSIETVTH